MAPSSPLPQCVLGYLETLETPLPLDELPTFDSFATGQVQALQPEGAKVRTGRRGGGRGRGMTSGMRRGEKSAPRGRRPNPNNRPTLAQCLYDTPYAFTVIKGAEPRKLVIDISGGGG